MNCSYNTTVLRSVMPPVLGVEFILGAVGNGFALWIFCLHLKPWRSSTILLFSLALADALLLVPLPFRIHYYDSNFEWGFGSALCNVCHFFVGMNRCGSIAFLIAIALDRYMRVVHPHHPVNFVNVSKATCGAAVLWLLTVVMSVFFTLNKSNQGYCGDFSSQCERNHTLSWHRLAFLLAFYAAFLMILFTTTSIIRHLRGRQIAERAEVKKSLSVMISIVILFAVCFVPSNITQLVIWFKASGAATQDCAEMERMTTVYSLTVSLTYLNSAFDPVVYFFSSSEFRRKCRDALGLRPSSDSTETRETSLRPESQPL